MAVNIELKRSAVPGKVPSTSSLNLGEIAINTFDGKAYIKKDNGTVSVVEIGNTTGSFTGSFIGDFTGSFTGSFEGEFTGSLLGTSSYALDALSASYAATSSYANDFTVAGTLTAQTIVVQVITSSTEYVTGSTIFGSQLSNTHQFTGSVSITGSLTSANVNLSGSFSGSFAGLIDSASYALSSSHAETSSYVNPLHQDVIISGSVTFDGGGQVLPNYQGYSGSIDLRAGSPTAWAELQSYDEGQYVWVDNYGAYVGTNYDTSSHLWNFDRTGSLTTPGNISIPNSSLLQGTASWAQNAITSSYAVATTSASYALSSSYALSASYALNASTASSILGGAQYYIPFWNTDTSLSSSYIIQSGKIGRAHV